MREQKHVTKNIRNLIFLFMVILLLNNSCFSQQPVLSWMGILGGNNSECRGVSADGSVAVGVSQNSNGSPRASIWTAASGIQDMGTLGGDWSEAHDVSADGSIIVGSAQDSNGVTFAFRWTTATGMQNLNAGNFSTATGISADGSVITLNYNLNAYRWTAATDTQRLATLGGNWMDASDISSDGSVIVGFSRDSAGDPYAFRWTAGGGTEQIGTYYSFARGISGDGNTVTGFETGSAGIYRAFSWTLGSGFMFNIAGNAARFDGGIIIGNNGGGAFRLSTAGGLEELNQVYSGLLSTGSDLWDAVDISADGQFVVGTGFNGATGRDEGFLIDISGITSIDESKNYPGRFVLSQNYPNPFNPSTTISYTIPLESTVSISIYNMLGQQVAILENDVQSPGSHEIVFNAENLSAGVYLYAIKAVSAAGKKEFSDIKKLILLK